MRRAMLYAFFGNMEKIYDVVIVGGGASGLLAGIILKKKNRKLDILILEKKGKLASKLLVTGNGKCNITNVNAEGYSEIERVMKDLGIGFRTDSEGRCYPLDGNAATVTETLKKHVSSLGIAVRTGFHVEDVKKDNEYVLTSEKKEIRARNVVFATGGKSYPDLGTTGDGYVMLRKLGHNIVTLIPALVPVTVKEDLTDFKGIRQKGTVSLFVDGVKIREEKGEVQFRPDALSGICVMNLSLDIRRGHECVIEMDFRNEVLNPKLSCDTYTFTVTGLKGWKEAQVTAGGVDLSEVDMRTMESKLHKGIYILGETLDLQGLCGGYNLSHAWLSAIRFGENFEIQNQ